MLSLFSLCTENMYEFDDINFDERLNLVDGNKMNNENESLYSELHTVQLENDGEKNKEMRMVINVNNSHRKSLQIKINYENNPFCIYHAEITEEAYTVLKQKQGLLVDFANFPNELISLLEKCRQCTQAEGRFFVIIKDDGSPTNDALGRHHIVFKLIETNCLKYLCYVMLTLAPVDISEVCKEVLMKMKQLKENISRGEHFYKQSIIKFKEISAELEQRNKDLEELKIQWNEAQKNWGKSLAGQISDIRAEYNASQETFMKEMEQKEKDLKMSQESVIKDMTSKMDQLTNENTRLNDIIARYEHTISTLKLTISTCNFTNGDLRQQLDKAKEVELDNVRELENRELTIKTLQRRLSGTRNKVVELTKLKATTEAQARIYRVDLVKKLHEKSEMYRNENRKVKDVCEELMQANSVIKQLQVENAFIKHEFTRTKSDLGILAGFNKVKIHSLQSALEDKDRQLEILQKSCNEKNQMIQRLELFTSQCLKKLNERENLDSKKKCDQNEKPTKNTLKDVKYLEVEPLNRKYKLSSTEMDNLRVMPTCSTNEAEHEKDNNELNHTTDTLYSTSVQGDKVTPNTSKDCKHDPSGIKKMLTIPQTKGSVIKYRSTI